MKKTIRKIELKKRTVQLLKNNEQDQLQGGAPTTNSGGACSFGTRCFVCYAPIDANPNKQIPQRP